MTTLVPEALLRVTSSSGDEEDDDLLGFREGRTGRLAEPGMLRVEGRDWWDAAAA